MPRIGAISPSPRCSHSEDSGLENMTVPTQQVRKREPGRLSVSTYRPCHLLSTKFSARCHDPEMPLSKDT